MPIDKNANKEHENTNKEDSNKNKDTSVSQEREALKIDDESTEKSGNKDSSQNIKAKISELASDSKDKNTATHDDNNNQSNDNDNKRNDNDEQSNESKKDAYQSDEKTTHSSSLKKEQNLEEANEKKQLSNDRDYDIVLYGATSFVGQLTAAYLNEFLAENESDNEPVRWAIAGRDEDKLNRVKKDIDNEDLKIIIADSEDEDSLLDMTAKTRVIISTVGPYLKYGEPLIKACTTNGTDYVDLTGEAIFIKDMMDKYQDKAKETNARIVNSCGFDSIPSDLGVLFTQECAKKDGGQPCDTITMRVKAAKGGLSGGTYASMATIFEEVGLNKQRQKQLANPYLLNDDEDAPKTRQSSINKPQWDAENNRWLAPFIMATINTRIVHRSNQLQDYAYGRDFKYDEAMWMPSGMKGRLMSYGLTVGMAGFAAGMMFKPTSKVIKERVLPQSGEGPSKSERENGYFDIRFTGYTKGLCRVNTKVVGDRDPGYGSTCRMLAQSALCLVQDVTKEQVSGGFWTPASAMGDALMTRLEQYADIHFTQVTQSE